MLRIEHASVEVTSDNLWFLERYLNVFDFADLFPPDAFSREVRGGLPAVVSFGEACSPTVLIQRKRVNME